jgi:hypothetical protein
MRHFQWVSRQGEQWEVRAGTGADVRCFATERLAFCHAINAARLVWVDLGLPSGVKLLGADGTWETREVFGLESQSPYA